MNEAQKEKALATILGKKTLCCFCANLIAKVKAEKSLDDKLKAAASYDGMLCQCAEDIKYSAIEVLKDA